jgi:hypothetical protein
LEKSLISKVKWGFVEGLWIVEMKFGTFRVSGSAFTCDARAADFEALPLGFEELVTPLRFGEVVLGVMLSIDIAVPVLEWRFASCSSLGLKVDLDGEF